MGRAHAARCVMRIGVLTDVECRVYVQVRISQVHPVRARGDLQLVDVVELVGQDRDRLRERD